MLIRINEKKIEVNKLGWKDSVLLSADQDLMEQAIYGLLANAIDATPDSTTLEISIINLGNTLEIHIQDSGPGLPFEPKSGNLEPGPSTKRFGTGLGIPIAFKICQKHNWHLDFNTIEGKGTKVIITAPINPEKELS